MPTLSSPANYGTNVALLSTLSWGSVNGAATYPVQVSSTSDFTGIVFSGSASGVTSLAVSPALTPSTTYYWRAQASNAGGSSAWSGGWSFQTVPPIPSTPALSVPSNGLTNAPVSLTLGWTSVSGIVSGYTLQVSTASGFSTTLANMAGLSSTSVPMTGLANSATFYWRASASNAGGMSAWSGAWSFTTIIAAPVSPAILSPANNAVGLPLALTLAWGTPVGVASYELQVSAASDFSTTMLDQSGNFNSQPLSGLTMNTMYYWRVNATNIGGTSAWAATQFTTYISVSIPLLAGWNMKSLNILPVNDSAKVVFGTLGNKSGQFLYIKDVSGNAYCPLLSQDAIHRVGVGQGYQVYTNVADTLQTYGSPVNLASTPIALSSGWNLVGYLPQTNDSAWHALQSIVSSLIILKDNAGNAYWPALGIDELGEMRPFEGYKVLMNASVSFTYPTPLANGKLVAGETHKPLLRLPAPKHYTAHAVTDNNALIAAQGIYLGNNPVADGSEIGVFDGKGTLVGAGTVLHGAALFAVWGDDPMTSLKDGCAAGESVTFKLWNGTKEYPLNFSGSSQYRVDGISQGRFAVSEGLLITRFDLTKVYPNPFRGQLKIAFDVPTLNNISEHHVEINMYDMKGSLVHQLAKGNYHAGHYNVSWNCSGEASVGPGVYIITMKANNFEKRMKLIRIQ